MEKEEVLKRIEEIPAGFNVFIGPDSMYEKEELKDHIENNSEIGKGIIEIESSYDDFMKNGKG